MRRGSSGIDVPALLQATVTCILEGKYDKEVCQAIGTLVGLGAGHLFLDKLCQSKLLHNIQSFHNDSLSVFFYCVQRLIPCCPEERLAQWKSLAVTCLRTSFRPLEESLSEFIRSIMDRDERFEEEMFEYHIEHKDSLSRAILLDFAASREQRFYKRIAHYLGCAVPDIRIVIANLLSKALCLSTVQIESLPSSGVLGALLVALKTSVDPRELGPCLWLLNMLLVLRPVVACLAPMFRDLFFILRRHLLWDETSGKKEAAPNSYVSYLSDRSHASPGSSTSDRSGMAADSSIPSEVRGPIAALFRRLYALFPCALLAYCREEAETSPEYDSVIQSLIGGLRMHPALLFPDHAVLETKTEYWTDPKNVPDVHTLCLEYDVPLLGPPVHHSRHLDDQDGVRKDVSLASTSSAAGDQYQEPTGVPIMKKHRHKSKHRTQGKSGKEGKEDGKEDPNALEDLEKLAIGERSFPKLGILVTSKEGSMHGPWEMPKQPHLRGRVARQRSWSPKNAALSVKDVLEEPVAVDELEGAVHRADRLLETVWTAQRELEWSLSQDVAGVPPEWLGWTEHLDGEVDTEKLHSSHFARVIMESQAGTRQRAVREAQEREMGLEKEALREQVQRLRDMLAACRVEQREANERARFKMNKVQEAVKRRSEELNRLDDQNEDLQDGEQELEERRNTLRQQLWSKTASMAALENRFKLLLAKKDASQASAGHGTGTEGPDVGFWTDGATQSSLAHRDRVIDELQRNIAEVDHQIEEEKVRVDGLLALEEAARSVCSQRMDLLEQLRGEARAKQEEYERLVDDAMTDLRRVKEHRRQLELAIMQQESSSAIVAPSAPQVVDVSSVSEVAILV